MGKVNYANVAKSAKALESRLKSKLILGKAAFTKDEEGVIVMTDIWNGGKVTTGEVVYDGKNAMVLNRNGENYYVFKNIPPYIRDVLSKAEDVTIVEGTGDQDIYSYSVKVRMVDDLEIADEWEEYAAQVMENLEKNMTSQELADFIQEAQKVYEQVAK